MCVCTCTCVCITNIKGYMYTHTHHMNFSAIIPTYSSLHHLDMNYRAVTTRDKSLLLNFLKKSIKTGLFSYIEFIIQEPQSPKLPSIIPRSQGRNAKIKFRKMHIFFISLVQWSLSTKFNLIFYFSQACTLILDL